MLTTNSECLEQTNHNGLKCFQVWVPDTSAPEFIEECKKQAQSLQNDPHEKEVLDWIESVADIGD